MYEKRIYIRVPVGIEGSYQQVSSLSAPRLGITRDVSLGCARFSCSERLEPGSKVALTLDLPEEGLQRVAPMEANPSTAHLFIVNPLSGQALMSLFSTHPPLEQRIARLRAMKI